MIKWKNLRFLSIIKGVIVAKLSRMGELNSDMMRMWGTGCEGCEDVKGR
jgi:hypothetical protein